MYLKKVCRPPAVGWADFVVGARRICERAQCDCNPIKLAFACWEITPMWGS